MSHIANTNFFERVAEFIDEHEGMSYIPKHAEKLWQEERYEELAKFMNETDASLSQEHFHNYNLLSQTNVC
jgi:hypothetical protein